MSSFEITAALNNALVQFGIDNSIQVDLNLYDEKTDTSKPYLLGVKIPAGKTTADLGCTDVSTGIYQIDINYEKGIGDVTLSKMFDKLEQVFHAGASFSFGSVCVNILSYTDGQATRSGGWATMPTTITYDVYTNKIGL